MDRIWFIIKKSEHIGPYNLEELEDFYHTGKIELNTAIWTTGMEKPVALSSVVEFDDLGHPFKKPSIRASEILDDQQFPESFDEEILIDVLTPEKKGLTSNVEQTLYLKGTGPVDDEIPPIPDSSELDLNEIDLSIDLPQSVELTSDLEANLDIENRDEIESSNISFNDEFNHQAHNLLGTSIWLRVAIGVPVMMIALLLGRLSLEAYDIHYRGFSRPALMEMDQYSELTSFLSSAKPDELSVVFYTDYSQFWIANKYPFDGRVSVSLSSLDGEVLAQTPIALEAVGLLEDKLIRVTQFRFISGDKLYPGRYRLKIDLINRFKKSYWLEYLISLPKNLSMEKTILVGPYNQIEFDRQLKQYNQTLQQKNKNLEQEISQRFLTLKSIVNEIKSKLINMMQNLAQKKLDSKLKAKLIEQFEAEWTNMHGTLLTSFVLENESFFESLKNSNSERLSYFTGMHAKLTELSRNTAEASMSILEFIKASPSNSAFDTADKRISQVQELEELEREIELELNRLSL